MSSGWAQVGAALVGTAILVFGGVITVTNSQAESRVKIVQLEDKSKKSDEYDAFLQEQVDRNEERIIITETTIKYLKENFGEMNVNLKTLVKEVQELNINMAEYNAKQEKD